MSAPAVLAALATIGGIAAGVLFPGVKVPAVAILMAALAFSAAAWRAGRVRIFTPSVLLGFCAAGALLGASAIAAAERPPLRQFFDDARERASGGLPPIVIEGTLRSDAAPTEYGASMLVDVARVQTSCGWLPAEGGVRIAVTGALVAGLVDEWRAGRHVRLPVVLRLPATFRDPGVADEAFGMVRRGIALAGSAKSGALVEIVGPGHPVAEAAAALRAYARRAVAAALPGRPVAAAIVTAILVGDRGGLDPKLERRLQEAGTYHVIAISGGNVAILAGLAFLILRLLRVPPRAGSLVLAVLLCGYGYVAGGGASVARATIAAAVYLVATAADHRSPALNVLATVAFAVVIYEPLGVFDPGLLLSYGATLALLIGADRVLRCRAKGDGERPPLRGRSPEAAPTSTGTRAFQTLRAASASALSASLAVLAGTLCAELALFPVTASVFHRITLAGLALNFAAIPLMAMAQIAGLAVLCVAPVSSALAHGAGIVAGYAADGLTRSTALLDIAPSLAWRVPTPPLPIVALYYGGCLATILAPRRRAARAAALAATVVAALLIGWPSMSDGLLVRRSPARGQLRVTFLDVGQGDAMVVQFPGGRSMLVDAAGLAGSSFDLGERVITPAMLALGIRHLDYLAITHGDPDHVVGAPSVARDFNPRELWEGVPVPPHEILRELRALVGGRGGAIRLLRPDDRLLVGLAELRVLHPPEPDWERQRVRNDDSIVMELRYGEVSIVLPGDIGAAVEESLAAKLSDAPIRILKAAHHGSATSSSERWLESAHASAVIFSCGRDNRYGHPAPAVLQRAAAHGARIFRTDQDGAITVTSDGSSVTVTTFTGRWWHLRR